MDANSLCQLLRYADNVDTPVIRLPDDVSERNGHTNRIFEFLICQGWIVATGDVWSITPTGRLWIRSVEFNYDRVKFVEYGGATFLVHSQTYDDELLVWHSGSFVSITPARFHIHSPNPYVLRRDDELVETSAGPDPENAFTVACKMLVEGLKLPERLQAAPETHPHWTQLREFIESL